MKNILLMLGIIAGAWMIFKVSFDGVISWNVNNDRNNKANCIGVYDTIPCHQLKIEHLLRESNKPRVAQ